MQYRLIGCPPQANYRKKLIVTDLSRQQKGNAFAFPLFLICVQRLAQLLNIVFALELFNTSATVDELLLSCKERVARRANVKPHFRLC